MNGSGGTAGHGSGDADRNGRGRWLTLLLLSMAVLAAMSPWFTASAAGDLFRARFALSSSELAWLTGAVQVGFVAGTLAAAVLNLADLVPSRWYFAVSALLAAAANLLLLVPGSVEGSGADLWGAFGVLLALRFLTGFFLAGVYPPAMKMAATWFRSARGLAIGTVVGALTVGKAAPFLLRAGGSENGSAVVLGASLAALFGALLIGALYRDGPHPFPRRPFRWDLVGEVLRHRPTRLAIWGYLGHMWELYAMWSAIVLFFGIHFLGRAGDPASAAALVTFWVIALGGVGSVLAGLLADRLGRERVAAGALLVSGAISLGIGWGIHWPTWILVGVALVWGLTVVADSAQFSALVTEVSPQYAAGTALTLQTSLGFLLTTVTIQLVPVVAEGWGWGPAFSILAIGPVVGIWAMRRLERLRRESPQS
jgi:MFS family permease